MSPITPPAYAAQPHVDKIASVDATVNYDATTIPTNYPLPATAFPPMINTTILQAATGQPTHRTPIWCHRQAGRYLPEFREVRKHIDFFALCQNPVMAAEVTLQPLRRFDLDAAIIFSDILVIPQCIGMTVEMHAGKGPVLPEPIKQPSDIQRLKLDITSEQVRQHLHYVYKAITLTRTLLNGVVPLIGFSGAPWTLFCYMTEGGGAKTYNTARTWLLKYPKETHQVMQLLTDVIVSYLIGQVDAGAQMLEVFDTWSGELSVNMFTEFSLPYLKQIVSRIKQSLRERNLLVVPVTLFAKDAHFVYELIAQQTEYDVMSVDVSVNRREIRRRLYSVAPRQHADTNKHVSIQGNLEPCALYADEDVIRREVRTMLDEFGTQKYIANLGHGMLPDHEPEKLAVFIDEVHKYSEQINSQSQNGTSSNERLAAPTV